MTVLEILLLVAGGLAFIISFFLPDKGGDPIIMGIPEEELRERIDEELDNAHKVIEDMTEESVNYSLEKTQRSLDKLANEKIMALGDYSDTIMEQISTNHNETVFLYDMLNKNKDELTELLNRADQTSRDANVRANEAYDLASNAANLAREATERAVDAGRKVVAAEEKMIDARRMLQEKPEVRAEVKYTDSRSSETDAPESGASEEVTDEHIVSAQEENLRAYEEEKRREREELDELIPLQDEIERGILHIKPERPAEPEKTEPEPAEEGSGPISVEAVEEQPEEKQEEKPQAYKPMLTEEEMMEQLLREATSGMQKNAAVRAIPERQRSEGANIKIRRKLRSNHTEEPGAVEGPAPVKAAVKEEKKEKRSASPVALQFAPGARQDENHNDRILEMHRMGRSNMAIAKDLGLGIGEVKLVIDLFENAG